MHSSQALGVLGRTARGACGGETHTASGNWKAQGGARLRGVCPSWRRYGIAHEVASCSCNVSPVFLDGCHLLMVYSTCSKMWLYLVIFCEGFCIYFH